MMLNIEPENCRFDEEYLIAKLTSTDWSNFDIIFLLGAGCSRSSGIPGAKELASRWLRELHTLDHVKAEKYLAIEKSKIGDYYFDIFFARFHRTEYKDAIASFIKAAYPGLGYTIFANLLGSSEKLAKCKTIITTNFDNLIEQAFILFTSKRPVVIPESSLIKHMRNDGNISIVKIHGDSRYEPKNDEKSVATIAQAVKSKISERVSEGILIVLGYGGADNGVAELIAALVKKKRIKQIWWVDKNPPGRPIQEKLPRNFKEFFHIKHADFDDFMLKLRHRINVPHFSSTRMDEHIYSPP